MNYFEHHIGDYDKNTSHLTACEDGIYSRMIRRYMDKERPLDVDTKEIKRIVRARNREEKSAVDAILKEFFHFENDGWHHKTCDETIAAYQAGEPEREVKKANEDNRLKRHRAERADLFKAITNAGQHAPWNIGMNELRELVKRLPETPLPPLPATAPATLATATQTPIPNTHTPVFKNKADDDSTDSSTASSFPEGKPEPDSPRAAPLPPTEDPPQGDYNPAIALTVTLRKWGVNASFTHPAVQDWTTREISLDILAAAVAEARETKGDAKLAPNYLVPIVEKLLNPPAKTEAKPRADAPPRKPQGMDPKGLDEPYDAYDARIQAELNKRKGPTP